MRSWMVAFVLVAVGCSADEIDASLVVSPGEGEDATEKADRADAPRVELKVALDPSSIRRARRRLQLTNSLGQERGIWFYDTPDLALFEAGAVLRARDIAGADDDSTVKLRPLAADAVGPAWLTVDGFKCEVDRLPDRSMSSCSLTADQDEDEIEQVAAGERRIDQLFSKEQEAFLAELGPAVDWDELVALGPVPARVWNLTTGALPAKLTAELWTLPDGEQVLELSMKVDANAADEAMETLLGWVAGHGLGVDAAQETKTRRALEQLVAPPPAMAW